MLWTGWSLGMPLILNDNPLPKAGEVSRFDPKRPATAPGCVKSPDLIAVGWLLVGVVSCEGAEQSDAAERTNQKPPVAERSEVGY